MTGTAKLRAGVESPMEDAAWPGPRFAEEPSGHSRVSSAPLRSPERRRPSPRPRCTRAFTERRVAEAQYDLLARSPHPLERSIGVSSHQWIREASHQSYSK